jgi:DegV family protein with EDD domain
MSNTPVAHTQLYPVDNYFKSIMPKACILTDSTAQFVEPDFPGHKLVNIVPLHIHFNEKTYTDGQVLKVNDLPLTARSAVKLQVSAPSTAEFHLSFERLAHYYNDAIVILLSSNLNPATLHAQEAASTNGSPITIHVIDSQTTSAGLGLLVQIAAELANNGTPAVEINHLVRGLIPHIYTIFCVRSLTYLHQTGLLDPAQALVGEMLGITQFFLLDKGHLTPVQKARSTRNLVDIFHEFIAEFNHLRRIALLYGASPHNNELHYLRERITGEFAAIPYSEHLLTASLSAILGPCSLGLVTMDD